MAILSLNLRSSLHKSNKVATTDFLKRNPNLSFSFTSISDDEFPICGYLNAGCTCLISWELGIFYSRERLIKCKLLYHLRPSIYHLFRTVLSTDSNKTNAIM